MRDERSFRPHPGDPWHPEWEEEEEAGGSSPPADDAPAHGADVELEQPLGPESGPESEAAGEEEKKRRFGWFRSKKKDDEDVESEDDEGLVDEAPEPHHAEPSIHDRFKPPPSEPAAGEEPDLASPPEETPPLPSWLTSAGQPAGDRPSAEHDRVQTEDEVAAAGPEARASAESDAALGPADSGDVEPEAEATVGEPDLEALADSEATVTSEVAPSVAASGDEEPEVDAVPAEPDLEALAAALGAEASVTVDEDEEAHDPDEIPSPREITSAAPDGGHGVASTAVYESLGEIDEEDAAAWQEYVEAESAAVDAPPDLPVRPSAVDDEPAEEAGPEPDVVVEPVAAEQSVVDEVVAEEPDLAPDEVVEPAGEREGPVAEADPGLPSWASTPVGPSTPSTVAPGAEPEWVDAAAEDVAIVEEPGEPLPTERGVPDVADILDEATAADVDEVTPTEPVEGETPISAPGEPGEPLPTEGGVPDVADILDEATAADVDEVTPTEPLEGETPISAPGEPGPPLPEEPGSVVVEEAAEWAGTAGRLPDSWFADLDEDEVEPPPAGLPEWEIELEPDHSEADAGGVDQGRQFDGGKFPSDEMATGGDQESVPDDVASPGASRASVESPDEPMDTEQIDGKADDTEWEMSEEEEQAGETEIDPGAEELPDEVWGEEDDPVTDDDRVTGPIYVTPPQDQDTEEIDPEAGDWSGTPYIGSVTAEHRGLAEEVARRAEDEDTELQAVSAAMPGLGTGVVGFEDVADLSTGEDEYAEPAPSDFGVRVVTAVVLLGLLLGSLWVGGEALAVFIGLMMLLGLGEFYATLRQRGHQPIALFGLAGGGGALVATWFYGPISVPVAIVATAVLTFFFYSFRPNRRDALTNGGLTVLGVAWIAGTAAFAFPILGDEHYRVLIFGIAAATVAMDVGAYFFGRTWGSSPLAPVLSPNKSVEGLAGGVVLAIGVAVLIGRTMEPFDIEVGAALGLLVAVLAPVGDLVESMVKRSLGVKDMGSVLPGHGGVLDRVDAFLFVLPAAWVLFVMAGLI